MASPLDAVPSTPAKDGADPNAKPAPALVTAGSPSAPPRPTTAGSAQSARPATATSTAPRKSESAATVPEPAVTDDDGTNPLDFAGVVDTNHDLPSAETIRKIDNYVVLDRDGKSHTFRSLYTGRHTARRVLIIFVRHFYCGNCQQYLRHLSESITPSSLLALPISTFIAVIGCGDPALIDMYADASNCPFPIYTDPTRKLYAELGMVRTLALGQRPAYMKTGLVASSLASIAQGLRQVPKGNALRGGDGKQVGGEFLFEPVGEDAVVSPLAPPPHTTMTTTTTGVLGEGEGKRSSETSLDGKGEDGAEGEDKSVTWCHRMRTTRDHAEIPELMEVLGLDGHGRPVEDRERWERAVRERKGTGVSLASEMERMKVEAGSA